MCASYAYDYDEMPLNGIPPAKHHRKVYTIIYINPARGNS